MPSAFFFVPQMSPQFSVIRFFVFFSFSFSAPEKLYTEYQGTLTANPLRHWIVFCRSPCQALQETRQTFAERKALEQLRFSEPEILHLQTENGDADEKSRVGWLRRRQHLC